MPKFKTLYTPFENSGLTWDEYPRPQMVRDSFFSLCGAWHLSVLSNDEEKYVGEITVPFPPESRLSGIERALGEREAYLYDKVFSFPRDFNRGRFLLHFGAVDQIAAIYLNGNRLGKHVGGYLPFSFDVTDYILLEEENHIRVEVVDSLDSELPYGKQRKDRGGMWYTPISGIWQTVWMESVPKESIQDLKISTDTKTVTVEFSPICGEKTLKIQTENGEMTCSTVENCFTVNIPNPHLWSPEDPYLYSFTLECGEDKISSYFALRTITSKKIGDASYLCLNDSPYFFHGVLDQGYFPDGIYLPASPVYGNSASTAYVFR